jgi:SAM-dependent methyltransferase
MSLDEQEREGSERTEAQKLQYVATRENYDRAVDWHEQKSDSYDWSTQRSKFLAGLPGTRILDAGCGTGRDIGAFLEAGTKVEGMDFSKASLERVQEKYPGVPVFEGDLRETLEQDEGAYDGIWACAAILNLSKADGKHALREFYRLLTESGKLFVSVKAGEGERMVSDQAGERLFSFYSPEELRALVSEAGFDVDEVTEASDEELTGVKGTSEKPGWICLYAEKKAKR